MSRRPGFELFDHTADIGVRAFAPTLSGLVDPATRGLYACIGELVAAEDLRPERFEHAGDDPALLLRDYLAEILRLFERRMQVVVVIEAAELNQRQLVVQAQVGEADRRRSDLEREVKAITYHELAVRPVAGGFEAVYIVDI